METVQTTIYNNHSLATAYHDAGSKKVVIFCYGYRGTSVGPSRLFVLAARKLAEQGISSLRFDQFGSGNSEGSFYDSSFDDWVATTKSIVNQYIKEKYEVALFGQSMGGATVICVSETLSEIKAAVAWVPDPNVEDFISPKSGYIEEGSQRVNSRYWQEAHDANVAERLGNVKIPMYMVQCSEDEYVSAENHRAIEQHARPNHKVEMFYGYKHSSWSYEQAEDIINKSVDFLIKTFE